MSEEYRAKAKTSRKIDVSKFYGKAPWLTVPVREDFDDPPRAWDAPDWPDYNKSK